MADAKETGNMIQQLCDSSSNLTKSLRLLRWIVVSLVIIIIALEVQVQLRNKTIDEFRRTAKITAEASRQAKIASDNARIASNNASVASDNARKASEDTQATLNNTIKEVEDRFGPLTTTKP